MAKNSIGYVQRGLSLINQHKTAYAALFLAWYLPVFLLRRLYDAYLEPLVPERIDPVIDDVLFTFVFGLFAVAIVLHEYRRAYASDANRIATNGADTFGRFTNGVLTFSVSVIADLPVTILTIGWPNLFAPSIGPLSSFPLIPFRLLAIAIRIAAFLVLPIAVFDNCGPGAAFVKSWRWVRKHFDTAIVTMVVIFIVTLPLLVLVAFGMNADVSDRIALQILWWVALSVPAGLAVTITTVVALVIRNQISGSAE